MATVLLSFGRETLLIVSGKTLLLLSLLLIFIQIGIVAGMFFDELSILSLKGSALISKALILIKIYGLLSKISLITSVNLPFLLLFTLMVLLLILLLKRLISSASISHLTPPCSILAFLLLLLSGIACLYT